MLFFAYVVIYSHIILEKGRGDSFTAGGFNSWNKKDRLAIHVGPPNSAHNYAWQKCIALLKQNQHIEVALSKQSNQVRSRQDWPHQ